MLNIDLSGKVALVTGGTGQLGRALVRVLAQAGAGVAIHYHSSTQKAEELVAEVTAMGCRAVKVKADITQEESTLGMRDVVRESLGDPDIVVANAVIQYEWTSILDQDIHDYESQFRSNVLQSVLLAKAFVPAMQGKEWGRFIAINSECSMLCLPRYSAYVAGKRGMDGVLRVLAHEVGAEGITVNQVAPGWTITEDSPDDGGKAHYRESCPLKRRGTDSEVAGVVAFLASDLAGFITGAYVPVCGGRVMPGI